MDTLVLRTHSSLNAQCAQDSVLDGCHCDAMVQPNATPDALLRCHCDFLARGLKWMAIKPYISEATPPSLAGVRMAAPAKFVAVHISGSGDPDMPYNYAVSVRHPFFAAQYVTHVVPSLTQLSDAAFLECAPDALATLHKYLQFVLTLPEQDASVVSIVDAFMAAHPLL